MLARLAVSLSRLPAFTRDKDDLARRFRCADCSTVSPRQNSGRGACLNVLLAAEEPRLTDVPGWEYPPDRPDLADDLVHVWRVIIASHLDQAGHLIDLLDDNEVV